MTCLDCNVCRLEYYHRSYGFGLTAGTSILEWSGSNLAAVSIQQGEQCSGDATALRDHTGLDSSLPADGKPTTSVLPADNGCVELTGPDSSRLQDTLKKFAEQASSVDSVCQWGSKEAPAALSDAVLAAGRGQGLRVLQLSAQQFCSKLTDIGFYLGSYPRVKFVVVVEGDDSSLNQALQAVKSGQHLSMRQCLASSRCCFCT